MRQRRFTEAPMIGMIKEQAAGMPTAVVCRRHMRIKTSTQNDTMSVSVHHWRPLWGPN